MFSPGEHGSPTTTNRRSETRGSSSLYYFANCFPLLFKPLHPLDTNLRVSSIINPTMATPLLYYIHISYKCYARVNKWSQIMLFWSIIDTIWILIRKHTIFKFYVPFYTTKLWVLSKISRFLESIPVVWKIPSVSLTLSLFLCFSLSLFTHTSTHTLTRNL